MSEEKNKSIRDEETLAKVLEAAYVIQERNRRLKKMEARPKLTRDQLAGAAQPTALLGTSQPQDLPPKPRVDPNFGLAQIVEIQHQIQVRRLELDSVMSLIAERMTQIADARSAAIGILDGKTLRYPATAGVLAPPVGTEVPMEKALCVDCIRTGKVFRCADINTETVLDHDECRRRGIQSMIAVPVFHDGGVAGSLELYFPKPQVFTEEEVHTCQFMAGLVSEALARSEKVSWKKSLASERALMLEALEKLKPNLAVLADPPPPAKNSVRPSHAPATPASTFACPKCGHELVGQELFCGSCGLPRSSDYGTPSLQSTIASLWHMQEATKKAPQLQPPQAQPLNGTGFRQQTQANVEDVSAGNSAADSSVDSIDDHVSETYSAAQPYAPAVKASRGETTESTDLAQAPLSVDFENSARTDLEAPLDPVPPDEIEIPAVEIETPEQTALAKPEHAAAWSSAATARDFLEQLAAVKDPWAQFWNTRRGDIYLAIAVVLVLGVIRWGIWSNHSVSAPGSSSAAAHRRVDPEADLSLFDRILVKLGLAEVPEPPQYKGNPRTQVWVDLQTALYYCPGADLYGKTPKGRFSSQRDAQLDQFEPAYRKTCD